MGLMSSRGKRPSRLHCSMMGIRFSSMKRRVLSRTRRSSSERSVSISRKSTPLNLMAMMKFCPVMSCRSHLFQQKEYMGHPRSEDELLNVSGVKNSGQTRCEEEAEIPSQQQLHCLTWDPGNAS